MQAGIASGPQALGLLSAAGMPALAPLSALCLSLIALAAGAELHLPELRRLRRQVRNQGSEGLLAKRALLAVPLAMLRLGARGTPLPSLLHLLGCPLQVLCVTAGIAAFSWVLVYAWWVLL